MKKIKLPEDKTPIVLRGEVMLPQKKLSH